MYITIAFKIFQNFRCPNLVLVFRIGKKDAPGKVLFVHYIKRMNIDNYLYYQPKQGQKLSLRTQVKVAYSQTIL